MATINKLQPTATLPYPLNLNAGEALNVFLLSLVRQLSDALNSNSNTVNTMADEFNTAFLLPTYAKAALPDVAVNNQGLIMVSDDVGGRVPAFSDGVNWRRVTDRNVIS